MPTARLDDRGVVAVTGEDARHFLDNLLSNDAPAGADAPTFAALLTPQGKILADMIVHAVPDGFLLDMRRDMLAALRARLGLYKLRAQVTIAEASGLAVFAAWDNAAEGRSPDPRLPMLGARFVSAPEAVAPDATTNDFHRHRLALGVPEAGLDFPFSNVFPHEAGMDALHGVSFTKGCYIGQEVVSRMKHRGTARTRPVVVTAEAALPDPGAEITAGERVIGRLGMSFSGSGADGRRVALVRLDRAAEAKAAGLPIRAGATDVSLALPSWATWGWPASEPASSGGAAS